MQKKTESKIHFAKIGLLETPILETEKKLKFQPKVSRDTFLKIAEDKSSISYSMIEALSKLGKCQCNTSDLIKSLKSIHIAFQLLDDIDDFKLDISLEQKTLAIELVNNNLDERNHDSFDSNFKHKYLFVSGIATELIRTAEMNFNDALEISTKYQLLQLSNFIKVEIQNCRLRLEEISLLIEKTIVKSNKSLLYTTDFDKSLDTVIHDGVDHLQTILKQSDGFFHDFLTSAGHGKIWVTSYVGTQLVAVKEATDIVNQVVEKLSNLKSGSYNESIPDDADSSSFLIWFFLLTNRTVDNQSVRLWLNFMNDDGGWVTYRNENELRKRLNLELSHSVNGWMNSTSCVSAVACNVLSMLPDFTHEYNLTASYLCRSIEKNGRLFSYWWTNDIYAVAYAIMGLSKNLAHENHILKCCDWLVAVQDLSGGWANGKRQQLDAFYTSLAIKALLSLPIEIQKKFRRNIDLAIKWLVRHQMQDGSWNSNRILQIPSPDVTDVVLVRKWRMSSFGVNVIVDDHYRTFSTSTTLNSLGMYRDLYL